MKLREGLSKSSPNTVTTNLRANFPELDALKGYLFTETDYEHDFRHDYLLIINLYGLFIRRYS